MVAVAVAAVAAAETTTTLLLVVLSPEPAMSSSNARSFRFVSSWPAFLLFFAFRPSVASLLVLRSPRLELHVRAAKRPARGDDLRKSRESRR